MQSTQRLVPKHQSLWMPLASKEKTSEASCAFQHAQGVIPVHKRATCYVPCRACAMFASVSCVQKVLHGHLTWDCQGKDARTNHMEKQIMHSWRLRRQGCCSLISSDRCSRLDYWVVARTPLSVLMSSTASYLDHLRLKRSVRFQWTWLDAAWFFREGFIWNMIMENNRH